MFLRTGETVSIIDNNDEAEKADRERKEVQDRENAWPADAMQEIRRLRKELSDTRASLHTETMSKRTLEARFAAASVDLDESHSTIKRLKQTVVDLEQSRLKAENDLEIARQQLSTNHTATTSASNPLVEELQRVRVVESPDVAILSNSMGRGVEEELQNAGFSTKGHVFPGATITDIAEEAAQIFTPLYQPKKIFVQVGGIDALRYRAPKVTKDYKRLVSLLRALCPRAELVLSHLTYKDYHNKNSQRVIEGVNRKTNKPEFFVPSDRVRIDNINISLNCWAKSMPNVQAVNATPGDCPENFSRRDGLHFSRVGRELFLKNVVNYFTDAPLTDDDDEMSEASLASDYFASDQSLSYA